MSIPQPHFLLRDIIELLRDFAQYSDLQCHSRRRLAGSPFGDRAHESVGFWHAQHVRVLGQVERATSDYVVEMKQPAAKPIAR
jgi:hypothetical protein